MKREKDAEGNIVTYCATQNHNGIIKRYLIVEGRKVVGEFCDKYPDSPSWLVPYGLLSAVGVPGDWRLQNLYFTKKKAIEAYVALENERIERSRKSLARVQGENN